MLPFEKFHGHGYVVHCPCFVDIEALQILVPPKSGTWPLTGLSPYTYNTIALLARMHHREERQKKIDNYAILVPLTYRFTGKIRPKNVFWPLVAESSNATRLTGAHFL